MVAKRMVANFDIIILFSINNIMDNTTSGILGSTTAVIVLGIIYKIYKAVNHKSININLCGKKWSASVDIHNTDDTNINMPKDDKDDKDVDEDDEEDEKEDKKDETKVETKYDKYVNKYATRIQNAYKKYKSKPNVFF